MPWDASLWRLAIAIGLTQLISWGSVYYAFSLVISQLGQAAQTDRTTVVGAFSVALLVSGLCSAPMGRWIDRHGGRSLMSAGSLAAALLLVALTEVTSTWQLYAVWMGLGVAMAANLYDPAFAVLAQAFAGKHRQAITVVTVFGGLASTVFWPLTQHLVQHLGWQQALWVLAALHVLVNLPVHALMLPRTASGRLASEAAPLAPPDVPEPPPTALLRDPAFYGLCLAFTGNALVFSAMAVHFISLMHSKGLSLAEAAWVGACIGPMQVLGRLLEHQFLSHWAASEVGRVAMWMLPCSLLLLSVLNTQLPGLLLFAFLYGVGNGVMTLVRGALPVELYGRSHYGAVNGALATPVQWAKAAGPVVAAWVLAGFSDVQHLLWLLAGVAGASALVFSRVTRKQ
ncbi:MAG: MFS transporter [Burkholderiales bacterium]